MHAPPSHSSALVLGLCGRRAAGRRPGQVDRRRLHDLDAGFGPVRPHPADVQGQDRHRREGHRAGHRAGARHGRRGDADVVFVHAKAQEEKFVADGFGVKRFDVMYNDFVLIGPKADPAKIKGGKDVLAGAEGDQRQGRARSSRAATSRARTRPSWRCGRRQASIRPAPSRPGIARSARAWAPR